MAEVDERVLLEIQRRVLWLATRMVDAANHDRDTGDGVKVGGHQASSSSLVTAMTALYFAHLEQADRVAVKPHASPVFHAIQYLLGNLDRSYLTRLRARGGLQSYPSRRKDPDEVDFATGSVGLGAAAPLFAAATRRYVDAHFGPRPASRFISIIGDAELDDMPNEQYQSLFGQTPEALRKQFLDGAPVEVEQFVRDINDADLAALVTDLGGHDLQTLLDAFRQCDQEADRPSVVFAYTIKGWGLPIAGNPRNHSALLSVTQIDELRAQVGLDRDTKWDRLDPSSPAGAWANSRREVLARPPRGAALAIKVPESTNVRVGKAISTQEVFGRVLVELARNPEVAPYLVTAAPDVATSTNLAGFINKVGVFAPVEQRLWSEDPILRWRQSPEGKHIELGISEMNLFLLLGQLGLSWDLSGQALLPVGTVYDPFVLRGLDAFIYSVYSGARFIIAGTPSGVTLAPEGGAHQSTITPSVGLEQPGVTFLEPAYATALDWLLCDVMARVAGGPTSKSVVSPGADGAFYFRLTTRPLDQAPFEAARTRLGDAVLRRQVLSGAYTLKDPFADHAELRESGAPLVHLVASGAVVPEALLAADELAGEGVAAHVIDVTSLERLYTAWQGALREGVRTATAPGLPGALRAVFADRAPIVTVHDAASHTMAWLGSAMGVPCVPLGVDDFGQSGSVQELYELHDLLPGSIVNAALAALSLP